MAFHEPLLGPSRHQMALLSRENVGVVQDEEIKIDKDKKINMSLTLPLLEATLRSKEKCKRFKT